MDTLNDGLVLKSDVLKIIEENIQNILTMENGLHNSVLYLYQVKGQIEKMDVQNVMALNGGN